MRKYVIMGVQGCGKGTQAKLLAADFDLVHISVGEIFRWHIQNRTKLAEWVKRPIACGSLVPDEVVEEVVRDRLAKHDWNQGFILDGFPRSLHQAEFLLEEYDVDAVVLIDVPDQVVLDRILNRRLCAKCGLDFNLMFHRPTRDSICDFCHGPLVARPDDTPEAIRARLEDYHTTTEPVLDLFRRRQLVVAVDGNRRASELQAEIRRRLGLARPPVNGRSIGSIVGAASVDGGEKGVTRDRHSDHLAPD